MNMKIKFPVDEIFFLEHRKEVLEEAQQHVLCGVCDLPLLDFIQDENYDNLGIMIASECHNGHGMPIVIYSDEIHLYDNLEEFIKERDQLLEDAGGWSNIDAVQGNTDEGIISYMWIPEDDGSRGPHAIGYLERNN